MEKSEERRKNIIEVLEENSDSKALFIIERELLYRERDDLSNLSAKDQYTIIIDKVGKNENSIIPTPTRSIEKFFLKHGEIRESNLPDILEGNELFGKLFRSKLSGKPLTVKVGVDPTATQIHLGHGITLRMMRRFQQMGHKIQFIIGDATAMVGDSTDRKTARQPLSKEQVEENMKNYINQASRIIDLSTNNPNVEVYRNSEWLNMSMMEWLPILQKISASRSMDRRDFQTRIKKGGSVSLGELMYPTFMAYDSVHLKSNIEIGGLDQYLNLLQTRDLMSSYNLEPETVITVDLLPGTTGATDNLGRFVKMSKSLGNYIALEESPVNLYTKIMSIPDTLMYLWFRELTEISSLELEKLFSKVSSLEINPSLAGKGTIDPIELKRMLARIIVASLNNGDRELTLSAERGSMGLVGKDSKLRPEGAVVISVNEEVPLINLLEVIGRQDTQLNSRSKIRKLIDQNGISILRRDSDVDHYELVLLKSLQEKVGDEMFIKIGKKKVFRVKLKNH